METHFVIAIAIFSFLVGVLVGIKIRINKDQDPEIQNLNKEANSLMSGF